MEDTTKALIGLAGLGALVYFLSHNNSQSGSLGNRSLVTSRCGSCGGRSG